MPLINTISPEQLVAIKALEFVGDFEISQNNAQHDDGLHAGRIKVLKASNSTKPEFYNQAAHCNLAWKSYAIYRRQVSSEGLKASMWDTLGRMLAQNPQEHLPAQPCIVDEICF